MGLQIHIPLGGSSISNKGISSNSTAILNSATYLITDRGPSLYLTTDGQGINLSGYMTEFKTYSNYSLMAWIYLDNTATNHSSVIMSSGNWNTSGSNCCFALGSYDSGYQTIWCPNTGAWNQGITLSNKILLGQWYHIAITYDGSRTIAYVNGIKSGEAYIGGITQSSESNDLYIGSATYYTGFTLKGKMRDIRIYNNYITEDEILQIVKQGNILGLTSHFPLSNNGLEYKNSNLLMNTYSMPVNTSSVRGFRVSGTGTVSHIDYNNLPVGTGVIRLTNSTSATAWGGIVQDALKGLIAGQKYSQSCWVRASTTITDFTFEPIWISNTQTTNVNVTVPTYTITTEWQYVKWEGVILNGDQAEYYSAGYAYATIPAEGWIEICGMKVELGDKATDWQPHLLDKYNDCIKYDPTEYIEPDGSRWYRIAHHNNPAGGLFTQVNFAGGVYVDANRWYNAEAILNKISKYEFMVKQKNTSSDKIAKYRWIQYANPQTATWEKVQPNAVTRISTIGYANGAFGGVYMTNNQARLCIANTANGDWWGAFGSWTAYEGGIPGFPICGVVTTGFMDLYIRVDNASEDEIEYDISGYDLDAKRIQLSDNLFYGSQFTPNDIECLNTGNASDEISYLVRYNTTAAMLSFSSDTCTTTLSTAGNLGIAFVRSAAEIGFRTGTTTYTISCEAKCSQSGAHLDIGLSYCNTAGEWIWRGGSNPQNFTSTNTWQKFTFTFIPDADTKFICYCFTVVGTAGGTDTFSIKHCKLEQGATATPWKPYNYQPLGFNDSPKYKCSTYFDGQRGILGAVNVPNNLTSTATVAAWVKPTERTTVWDRNLILKWLGIIFLGINQSGYLCAFGYGKDPAGYHDGTIAIPLNQWTHVAAVWDSSALKFYVNGQLDNTIDCTGNFSGSGYNYPIEIGIDTYNNGYYRGFVGNISDVRVYNKALDVNEILSLYNNGALVDSDGTIHGQIRD